MFANIREHGSSNHLYLPTSLLQQHFYLHDPDDDTNEQSLFSSVFSGACSSMASHHQANVGACVAAGA